MLYFYFVLLGLLVTCIAAIGTKSLSEFSRHELEEICRRRGAGKRLMAILLRHERVALAAETLQVVGTAVTLATTVLWTATLHDGAATRLTTGDWALGVGVGILLLLVVEVWIPWAVARLWATPFVFHTWPAWIVIARILAPLGLCARFVDTVLHRLAGRPPEPPNEEAFEEEIRTIVTEGHREGLLEEDAREMIEGVIELGDVDVSEIMTPRTDMICVPKSLSWEEAIDFVVRSGHSRLPVFDKNRDDIIGILVIKDLLPEMAKPADERQAQWTELLREACFVPETKPIDDLLREFQVNRYHMVVVLDEYGGVSGLVTLEDVLEEIVGDIVDEHDEDEGEDVREIDEHTIEALGRVHIDEINERLRIDLPEEEDYDTIGGFVFSKLGHVPVAGEHVLWNDHVRVTVLEASKRRVERVSVEVLDPSDLETAH